MKNNKNPLANRLLNFAAEVLTMTRRLQKSYEGRHVAHQLIRSATSAGANYEEACGAESRQDFIHKMQIVLKELKESAYWLNLIVIAHLIDNSTDLLECLISQVQELINIVAKSVITAKSKQ